MRHSAASIVQLERAMTRRSAGAGGRPIFCGLTVAVRLSFLDHPSTAQRRAMSAFALGLQRQPSAPLDDDLLDAMPAAAPASSAARPVIVDYTSSVSPTSAAPLARMNGTGFTHEYGSPTGAAAGSFVAPRGGQQAAVQPSAAHDASASSGSAAAPTATAPAAAPGKLSEKELRRMIRQQHAEHMANTDALSATLAGAQNRIATLESEAATRRVDHARAVKEVDRLLSAEQDARKRITKLQAKCNELEAALAAAQAAAKAAKGGGSWFGGLGMGLGGGSGSILTGGGAPSAAQQDAAASRTASSALKQLQTEMGTLREELLAKIAENQALHTAAQEQQREHSSLVQTLQHKIEESRVRQEKSDEAYRIMTAQLASEQAAAAEREASLQARVAELSSQVSSTLSSSSKADQAWLVQRAQYERVFAALKQAWAARVPFDDAALPAIQSLGLDLAVRCRFSRSAAEVRAQASASLRQSTAEVAALLSNRLLKHWGDKWAIQLQQQQQSSSVVPVPSAQHSIALQTLGSALAQKMDALQTSWAAVTEALQAVAGKSAAASSALVARSPVSSGFAGSDLSSFTLLLEPLYSIVHTLSQLCALQCALLDTALKAGGGHGGGHPQSLDANAATMRNHMAQLAQAWKAAQKHLAKGAAAIKVLMEGGATSTASSPSAAAATATAPPPHIALLLPATALSSTFTLPAAWLFEWLLYSPSLLSGPAAGGSSHSSSAAPLPPPPPANAFAAAHVTAWLGTLAQLMSDVSTKFAVVSMHEYRQQPTPSSAAAAPPGSGANGESVAAAPSSHDSAASAIHRSRLSELNNKLLIDLKTLPKLVEGLLAQMARARTAQETLNAKERQADQQSFQNERRRIVAMRRSGLIDKAADGAGSSVGAAVATTASGGEREEDPLDDASNPFAVYLSSSASSAPAAAASASTSRALLSLHSRATSFLRSLNRNVLAPARQEAPLPYAFSLQQRYDLGRLTEDFALLQERYQELESEHTDLQRRHGSLQVAHQAALENTEAQHDAFANAQMEAFEAERSLKEDLEAERSRSREARASLAATERELAQARALLEEQQTALEQGAFVSSANSLSRQQQPLDAQLLDTEAEVDVDASPPFSPAIPPAIPLTSLDVRSTGPGGHREDELDFLPTSSHAAAAAAGATGAGLDEMLLLGGSESEDALRGGGADHDTSFALHRTCAVPRSGVSDWLHQARQFEALMKEQLANAAKQPPQPSTSSFTLRVGTSPVALRRGAHAQRGGNKGSTVLRTPSVPASTESSLVRYAMVPGGSPFLSPPFLAHASPSLPEGPSPSPAKPRQTRGASGSALDDELSNGLSAASPPQQPQRISFSTGGHAYELTEAADEEDAEEEGPAAVVDLNLSSLPLAAAAAPPSAGSLSAWSLFQQASRLASQRQELLRLSRSVCRMHARNTSLQADLSRAHTLLKLLSTRASLAASTSSATLRRLQEVQLERSAQAQSSTQMMDELTERIFQLTQQLADKDARHY